MRVRTTVRTTYCLRSTHVHPSCTLSCFLAGVCYRCFDACKLGGGQPANHCLVKLRTLHNLDLVKPDLKMVNRKRKLPEVIDKTSYSSQEYWESRYQDPEGFHEWYCSYENLKPLLEMNITTENSVLEIGCGDSPLLTGMLSAGHFGKLHAIDFSDTIVKKVIEDHPKSDDSSHRIEYLVMDARKLTYDSDSWDAIIDKGTMDAMLSDKKTGLSNAKELISEAFRVVNKTAGKICLISHIKVDTPEYTDWMSECLIPVLEDHRSSIWKIEAHTGSTSDKKNSPTVYIISAKPRRFTRGCLYTAVVELKVLSHSDDDDEGDDEDNEDDDDNDNEGENDEE